MRFDPRSGYSWYFGDISSFWWRQGKKEKIMDFNTKSTCFLTYKKMTLKKVNLSLELIINQQSNILGRKFQRQKAMPDTVIS